MSFGKENFLRTKFVGYLQQLNPATPPRWGKMSVQQMIEHFSVDGVQYASGRRHADLIITPTEHLRKLREFMMSEKPFRENTRNPLMGEEPAPRGMGPEFA